MPLCVFLRRTSRQPMATEADVQDTTAAPQVSDPFGLRNHRCSARPVRKRQINVAIFQRISLSEVLKYVLVLVLLSGWLAITWGQVSLFLSEPTTTKIYWDKDFTPPAFSICPRLTIGIDLAFRHEFTSNQSMHQFIHSVGLPMLDMIDGLNETIEYQTNRSTDVFTAHEGTWRRIPNYAFGGTCATFMPKQGMKHLLLPLRRNRKFEIWDVGGTIHCYLLLLHGSSEFWGWSTPGMEMSPITSNSSQVDVFITVDREVRPNLRRAPCESDPSYSLAACQRRCFFDWLDCRMEESAENDGRPPCMASDAFPYSWWHGHRLFLEFTTLDWRGINPIDECTCPDPCVSYRFGFQVRPALIPRSGNLVKVEIIFEDVQRVLETHVTYTMPDLLADMGGYLGLMLGWSLLSLFGAAQELVVRACKRVLCNKRRRRKTAPTEA